MSQQKHGVQACGHVVLSCPFLREFDGSELNEGLFPDPRTATLGPANRRFQLYYPLPRQK